MGTHPDVPRACILLLAAVASCCGGRIRGDDDPDGASDAASDADGECTPREETCNYEDDDCDGVVDNGFDLSSDPGNCGACDVSCDAEHTRSACEDSTCVIEECEEGWHDVDGDPYNGCEYECDATADAEDPGDGTCSDGLDNDCDGRTDDEDTDCSDCVPEICNGLDDDCDDEIDEDFDLDADPLNCGECGNVCSHRPHSTPTCDGGTCAFDCDEGWRDVDGDPSNGCEEHVGDCVPVPDGTEITCNGVDEDCDGLFDEDYVPHTCGDGACEAVSTCVGGVEDCTPGSPAGTDDTCNGVDEDCDGAEDEHWTAGTCGAGVCVASETCVGGVEDCTPGPTTGTDDDCNDVDEDCDTTADEHFSATCGWGQCEATATCRAGVESCTPRSDDSVWPSGWASLEVDAVARINAERAAGAFCNGTWYPPVPALTMEADLREAARCHSLDMAENDFFSHVGSDMSSFTTRCSNAGYSGFAAGENIGAGYSSGSAVVAGWMSSTSGHCEMVMNSSVTQVGLGYAYDSSSYWRRYWTADFGR